MTTQTMTSVERFRMIEDDPGITTAAATDRARTPAHAPDPAASGVPFCMVCEVLGHATARCPRAAADPEMAWEQLREAFRDAGWTEAPE